MQSTTQKLEHLFTLRVSPELNMRPIVVKCFADYDRPRHDPYGKTCYRLEVRHEGRTVFPLEGDGAVLWGAFSPMVSIDGKDAREHALSHVALKPGDTDPEFFDPYTPDQLAFVERWGEGISMVAFDRYGEH